MDTSNNTSTATSSPTPLMMTPTKDANTNELEDTDSGSDSTEERQDGMNGDDEQQQQQQQVTESPVRRRKPLAETLRGIRSPFRADNLRGIGSPFRRMPQLAKLRRRSRSAPAAYCYSRRQRFLEEHFRVDTERKVVLPGVPTHGDDWARDTHDFFNLIVLIPIVALNVMNWNWETLLNLSSGKSTIEDAWTGEWFDTFFNATLMYFVVDLLWILIIPSCVRSPATIIQHHLVTILYIMIPLFRPSARWCMGLCMSVEVNTWFLIARRVFNKQGFPPWIIDLSFVSIRVKLISICFYVTWIGIRCILYPILLVVFTEKWLLQSNKVGTIVNIDMIAPVLHCSFCILNFRWTYDLIMSKIRYFRRKTISKNEKEAMSKGL